MQQTMLPVGVKEVASRAGVTEIAARKWIERHGLESATPFPRPVAPVSGRDAYWWHEVVDWLASSGRLTKVTRLDHPDTLAEKYITITYHVPARNWILAEHDDDAAVHSWTEPPEPPGRPWLHQHEEDLVADIRQLLLDGWTINRDTEPADR